MLLSPRFCFWCFLPAALVLASGLPAAGGASKDADAAAAVSSQAQVLNLDQCLQMAVEKNRRRPRSRFEVAMAEAQHKQALAGYWPQVSFKAAYQLLDQPVNFIVPLGAVQIPAQTVNIPAGTSLVTIPANAFGPGFPPANVQMPVAYSGQSVTTPAQSFAIPQENVTVLDRNLVTGSIDMKWLVFDGGMRKGLGQQANGYLEMMRAEAKRTDLEVTGEVRRMYWGAVLARQVYQVGKDTLARMEVTLQLTESLYKNSAGKVSKTDYLENQVLVESLRSMVALLEKESQFLLREGIGLQIKDVFLGLSAAAKSCQATSRALQAAIESRDLNERAYQNELVETEKVIRAQLVEALMSAQHFKTRFDYLALLSQLNLVIGREVRNSLKGGTK